MRATFKDTETLRKVRAARRNAREMGASERDAVEAILKRERLAKAERGEMTAEEVFALRMERNNLLERASEIHHALRAYCPGCNGTGKPSKRPAVGGLEHVRDCERCGGLYTKEAIDIADAERIIGIRVPGVLEDGSGTFYFDLTYIENGRIDRVHGWARNSGRRVTQVG